MSSNALGHEVWLQQLSLLGEREEEQRNRKKTQQRWHVECQRSHERVVVHLKLLGGIASAGESCLWVASVEYAPSLLLTCSLR
jgi:hypothetical protein